MSQLTWAQRVAQSTKIAIGQSTISDTKNLPLTKRYPSVEELKFKLNQTLQRDATHLDREHPLESPYSPEQLSFCAKLPIQLPPDLLWYLTNISKEFIADSYPCTVTLSQLLNFNLITHKDIEFLEKSQPMRKYGSERFLDLNECDRRTHRLMKLLMLKIGIGGCAFWDAVYVGPGAQCGTVWHYMDDDHYLKDERSFIDYVSLKNRFNQKD